MRTIGNLLWHFPFFGFITAAMTYFFGLLITSTVVAAPLGLGLMELGKFLFWPFGKSMVHKVDTSFEQHKAWRTFSFLIILLYLPLGIVLTIIAIFQILFLCFTVLGIAPAMVIAKSLGSILNPVHKKCVSNH